MFNKFSEMVNESKSSNQKIGLDIHGVINTLPEFFTFLADSFIKNGGEVHIITGGSWTKKLDDKIKSIGIKYTHKFSVYDHLIEVGEPTIGQIEFPDGTIQMKFDDNIWNSMKGKYCRDNGIDLHIDDTLVYNDFFSTPFARLWSHDSKSKSSHKDI